MNQVLLDDLARVQLAKVAHGIRTRVLRLTLDRNGCYLSQALSSAEILAVLYCHALQLGSSTAPLLPEPFPGVPGAAGVSCGLGSRYNGATDGGYDRLLISPAHYAVAVYAALVEAGRLAAEGLNQFNTDGSTVEMIGGEHSPGFELTTGSFGQALSQAGGIAWARRHKEETGRIFVFLSDGELEEGQTWEAMQAIAHHKLSNIVVICDINGQQVDGNTAEVMNIEPIEERIKSFGCTAVKIDGHDVEQLNAALLPTTDSTKTKFVLAYTDTARGIPELAERKPHLHFVRFKDEEERNLYAKILTRMQENSP